MSETCQNLEELKTLVKDLVVEPVTHISGKLNPADLITRDNESAADLHEDSEWFCGPAFLHMPVENMPFSRDFLVYAKEVVPSEELRTKRVSLLTTRFLMMPSGIDRFAQNVLLKADTMSRAVNVLARVLRAYITTMWHKSVAQYDKNMG